MRYSVIQISLIISILTTLAACADLEVLQDNNSSYKKDTNPADESFNFPTQIRSLIPKEHYISEQTTWNYAAVSWDNRLFFGTHAVTKDGQLHIHYKVSVLRPEKVKDQGDIPDFTEALSEHAVIETPANWVGFHQSVFRNPNFPENPYTSDANGNPNPNGAFETYKLGHYGVKEINNDNGRIRHLTVTTTTVVVGAPRTADAHIVLAQMDGPPQDMKTSRGKTLNNYEPSSSVDGRLVIWHGLHKNNGRGSVINASFNPNPIQNPNGWSRPISIVDLYYQFGAASNNETIVDGVPFSKRYPIAAEPMRGPNGNELPRGTYLPGAYPWLSQDASEAFFPTVQAFDAPLRSAVIAIGQRTNYSVLHLDGLINPSRSEVLSNEQIAKFSNRDLEGYALRNLYKNHSLGNGEALKAGAHHRLFVLPVTLTGSMWHPTAEEGTAATSELARRMNQLQHNGVYGFFLSHSSRYVEVDLHASEDRHYILNTPLNENLEINLDILRDSQEEVKSGVSRALLRQAWAHSSTQSVDLSGHFNTVTLNRAQFPYEYHKVQNKWNRWWSRRSEKIRTGIVPTHADCTSQTPNPRCVTEDEVKALVNTLPSNILHGDRIYGIFGNAVYFKPGSSVRVDFQPTARQKMQDAQALTLSFWFKPLENVRSNLVVLGDLKLKSQGRHIVLQSSNFAKTKVRNVFEKDQWTHISLRMNSTSAEVLINGEIVKTMPSIWSSLDSQNMIIGPSDLKKSNTAIALMDEVRLSDIWRSDKELEYAALIDKRIQPSGENELGLEVYMPTTSASLTPQQREAAAELGKELFSSSILSSDPNVSCASCHNPRNKFTDGREIARGAARTKGHRNSPTIFNRDTSTRQRFDGQAMSLEAQSLLPISETFEMNLPLKKAITNVNKAFGNRFQQIFSRRANTRNLAITLAAFQRTLISSNSLYDQNQLTPNERHGKALFYGKARCSSCHAGPNFTDERFHAIGLKSADQGHRGKFKTPTLREIQHTAPYFHDGSMKTLEQVVAFYSRGGQPNTQKDFAIQPLGLNRKERSNLVAFLRTLSGR